MQEFDAALQGQFGAGGFETGAVRTIEPVIRGVKMIDTLRVPRPDPFDRRQGDMRVLFTEVKHDGHTRLFRGVDMNFSAVVGYRGVDLEARCRQVGNGPAPAIAYDPDLAGGADAVDGSLHVEEHLVGIQRLLVADALWHVRIGHVDVALHAVEQSRSNGKKSRGRVLVGHRANVARHAEYLLDDDDSAARLGGRFAQIRRQPMTVGCGKFHAMSHRHKSPQYEHNG